MNDFISEDDLNTFEGFLRSQGIDSAKATAEELCAWRSIFDETVYLRSVTPKMGVLTLKRPGDRLYAVSVREDGELWLSLWVKRSKKGEFFVMYPRQDR
ncbi:MAG: hypothetical protein P8Z80_21225, partial [Pseudolabrys sp.]